MQTSYAHASETHTLSENIVLMLFRAYIHILTYASVKLEILALLVAYAIYF